MVKRLKPRWRTSDETASRGLKDQGQEARRVSRQEVQRDKHTTNIFSPNAGAWAGGLRCTGRCDGHYEKGRERGKRERERDNKLASRRRCRLKRLTVIKSRAVEAHMLLNVALKYGCASTSHGTMREVLRGDHGSQRPEAGRRASGLKKQRRLRAALGRTSPREAEYVCLFLGGVNQIKTRLCVFLGGDKQDPTSRHVTERPSEIRLSCTPGHNQSRSCEGFVPGRSLTDVVWWRALRVLLPADRKIRRRAVREARHVRIVPLEVRLPRPPQVLHDAEAGGGVHAPPVAEDVHAAQHAPVDAVDVLTLQAHSEGSVSVGRLCPPRERWPCERRLRSGRSSYNPRSAAPQNMSTVVAPCANLEWPWGLKREAAKDRASESGSTRRANSRCNRKTACRSRCQTNRALQQRSSDGSCRHDLRSNAFSSSPPLC